MTGSGWQSEGITIEYDFRQAEGPESADGFIPSVWGWRASVGYCDYDRPGGTWGNLNTRGLVLDDGEIGSSLGAVLDMLKADAERIGVTWADPHVCYEGGPERAAFFLRDDWQEIVGREAKRLGWRLCTDEGHCV